MWRFHLVRDEVQEILCEDKQGNSGQMVNPLSTQDGEEIEPSTPNISQSQSKAIVCLT